MKFPTDDVSNLDLGMVLLIGRATRRICFNQKDYQDLTRHQYGISAVAPRTPFREETNGGGARCRLLSQARTFGISTRFRETAHLPLP